MQQTLFPLHENMGKGTGMGTLIPTCPTLTSFSNLRAEAPDWVNMEAPFPYGLALTMAMASSSVAASRQNKTGPKISVLLVESGYGLKQNHKMKSLRVSFHGDETFNDRGPDKVSFFISGHDDTTSVEMNLTTFRFYRPNQARDALLSVRWDERTAKIAQLKCVFLRNYMNVQIRAFFEAIVYSESLGAFNKLR